MSPASGEQGNTSLTAVYISFLSPARHLLATVAQVRDEKKKGTVCKIQLLLSSGVHKEGSGQHQRAASAAARSPDEPLTADNLHYFTHTHTAARLLDSKRSLMRKKNLYTAKTSVLTSPILSLEDSSVLEKNRFPVQWSHLLTVHFLLLQVTCRNKMDNVSIIRNMYK